MAADWENREESDYRFYFPFKVFTQNETLVWKWLSMWLCFYSALCYKKQKIREKHLLKLINKEHAISVLIFGNFPKFYF